MSAMVDSQMDGDYLTSSKRFGRFLKRDGGVREKWNGQSVVRGT